MYLCLTGHTWASSSVVLSVGSQHLRDTGQLPEFDRYLDVEDEEHVVAPCDRDPDLLPDWHKVTLRRTRCYEGGAR